MAKKSTGRPKGSKTQEKDIVEEIESRCDRCGSPDRTAYRNTRSHMGDGYLQDGTPYIGMRWSDTTCRNCGQARIVRRPIFGEFK
jgi:ribosomal protein L37E